MKQMLIVEILFEGQLDKLVKSEKSCKSVLEVFVVVIRDWPAGFRMIQVKIDRQDDRYTPQAWTDRDQRIDIFFPTVDETLNVTSVLTAEADVLGGPNTIQTELQFQPLDVR